MITTKVIDSDPKGKDGGTLYSITVEIRLLDALDSEAARKLFLAEYEKAIKSIQNKIITSY